MKLINFLKNNTLLSIIGAIILSIVLIGFIGNKYIEYNKNNWEQISEKQFTTIEKIIKQELNYAQLKIVLEKEKIVKKLKTIKNFEINNFEELIPEVKTNNLLFALFDTGNNLKFWNDHYLEQISINKNKDIKLGKTYFANTDLANYIALIDTLSIQSKKYLLQIASVVEKDYQLNPVYFDDVNLTQVISEKAGVECKIYYSEFAKKSKDGRKHSIDILNNAGNKIGLLTFVKPSREIILKELETKISTVQSVFAVLGFLLLGILLCMEVKNYSSKILKFSFISLYLIVLRYLLIILNIPKSIVSSNLLDDRIYFSDFGYGLANSPLDLFITQIIFLIIIFLGFNYSYKFYKSDTEKKQYNIISFTVLLIFIALIYLFLLRGFGAGIRGFVFDTSLRYFQSTSLSSNFPHFVMHFNVLLLGLISVLSSISLMLILLAIKRKNNSKLELINFVVLAVILAIGVALFDTLQRDPQITLLIKIMHVFFIVGITYLLVNHNFGFFSNSVIIFSISSFLSIITLLNYNSELEKKSLQTTANVILRANEQWYKALINETITNKFSREEAVRALSKKNSNYNASAFKIWSKSKLQRESINSSVNFIGLDGELLGGFGSIYPNLSIKEIVDTNNVIEEVKIFEEPFESESQKLIRGIFPVKDHYSFLGYLDVSILMDLNDFGFNAHTELFSTGKLNDESILKLDKLVILDYQNKVLTSVYGELNPSDDINKIILSAPLNEKNEAWLDIKFNNSKFIFYVKKKNYTNLERVIAVGLRNKELSIGLFDFFKVFFNHVIILLILSFIYLLYNFKNVKKYQFNLRTKLLSIFLIISLIPLILTAFYFRNLTEDKNEKAIYYKLGKRAFSIEDYFNQKVGFNGDTVNIDYRDATRELNINYSVFDTTGLIYSSSDLLYDVGLIPQRLNFKVYTQLVEGNDQEILIKESIDKFKFNSFYYKANIFDKEVVIKVSDAFNKILLPLSGSEVDVFLFGTYSLAVLLIIGLSAFLANQISSSIRKLTSATKSVAAGDLSLEIKSSASGEVKDLVEGFHYMIKELKRNQNIIAEIEREEAWKEMAKQVAHEIKNPLTPMKLSVQQLITAYDDHSDKFDRFFKRVTSTILNQIETLRNIANEFSNFARMPKLKVEKINLIEIVKQSVNLFADESVNLKFNFNSNKLLINGDSEQLKRTIINLIRNSIQEDSTEINISTKEEADKVILTISDNGSGIKTEHINKIFEPNFTTQQDGMGLGLSMTKRYLKSTGADISVLSTSPNGTSIQITFPKITS